MSLWEQFRGVRNDGDLGNSTSRACEYESHRLAWGFPKSLAKAHGFSTRPFRSDVPKIGVLLT